MAEPRRTFGPVVLLGAAAATLAAVASSKVWVASGSTAAVPGGPGVAAGTGEMPLASALSLVLLACWGVVLVTRGRVRRLVAALGLLAALGVLVTFVVALLTLEQQVVETLRDQPLLTGAGGDPDVHRTGWFWAAGAGALLSVLATAAAVRFAPAWPEMGSRYDAPSAEARPDEVDSDAGSIALWKALDEGHDPTA